MPLGPEQGAPRVAELQEKLQHWTITADAASAAAFTPKYVENDNKVLRLFGYFKEAVPDSPAEPWRARRVQLLHYLTDDTWHITERTEPNSGIQQVLCFVCVRGGVGWARSVHPTGKLEDHICQRTTTSKLSAES